MTNPLLAGHYINASHSANQAKSFEQAKQFGELGTRLAPDVPEAWFNLGLACAGLNDKPAAIRALKQAQKLSTRSADALNSIGLQWLSLNETVAAEECFLRAGELAPSFIGPLANLAILRHRQGRLEEEIALLEQALTLDSSLPALHVNLGLALQSRKQFDDAQRSLRRAIELSPGMAQAWVSLGAIHVEQKNWDEAIECLERSLALDPNVELAIGSVLRMRMSKCDWQGFDALLATLRKQIERGRLAAYPHEVLSVIDDPALLRSVTSLYAQRLYPENLADATRQEVRGPKVRVGYFSSDFRTHPVGDLMAELLELHDHEHFEWIGFSLIRKDDDPIQRRIRAAFDQFIEADGLDPHALTRLARTMKLDIAVDLNGHTTGGRTSSFAMRMAPVQANYLGFAGTMGASYYDYLIADATVCPPQDWKHYTEKLAILPHGFMPHDSQRTISTRSFSRTEFGLPEEATVFCCFNNHYKITPAVFSSWMNILHNVEGSVLWLPDGPEDLKRNLAREAQDRGIASTRIVYAGRMKDASEHLARLALADLFLDTAPYNAHATAMDALWAGLPLITCQGDSFASRVASSLLVHIGMPELITSTPAEYEALAITLARAPERLAELREKLHSNRTSTSLFSSDKRARALEQLYSKMHEQKLAGRKPEAIKLPSQ